MLLILLTGVLSGYADASQLWPVGPEIYGESAVVMEVSTGLVLYEKNPYKAQFPASITKVLTSLLTIENCELNEIMTMSADAEKTTYGAKIGLIQGEQVTIKDALYGVLLESANEVTYGMAEHTGGTMKNFLKMMNERAAELGCVNSHFSNPHGLHLDDHYTCAYDMALIGRAAIQNEIFRTISGTRTYVIPPTNKNVSRPLANHHAFIRKTKTYEYAVGGKTGETKEALFTLVTFAEKDGMLIVCVVMRVDTSDHVYEDTKKLCNFAFDNFKTYDIGSSSALSEYSFISGEDNILSLASDTKIILPSNAKLDNIEKNIKYYYPSEFVHGKNIIGSLEYVYGDTVIGASDIVFYNQDYPITGELYNSLWPDYLIPIETAFSSAYQDSLQASLAQKANEQNSEPVDTDTRSFKEKLIDFYYDFRPAVIIATGSGLIVFIIGLYIMFVVSPKKKDTFFS